MMSHRKHYREAMGVKHGNKKTIPWNNASTCSRFFLDLVGGYVLRPRKGPLKLIQLVKIAHSFLHVMFHSVIYSLSM